jgi:hypothetical protein
MLRLGVGGLALLAAWLVLGAAAGAAFGPSTPRRIASALLLACLLALPFFGPREETLARGLVGLGGMLAVMRFVESARASRPPILPLAILFVLPVDVPTLVRAPPRLASESLARVATHALVLLAGLVLVWLAPAAIPSRLALRWLGGVLFVYGYIEVIASGARAGLAALGFDVAPMQRDPILARSVGELWGERWNRVVSSWLRRQLFLPVARRTGSAVAGVAAAFAWSVFLHAFMVGAALGLGPALTMGSYFVIQGVGVLIEARLLTYGRPTRGWPGPLARAWTIAWVVGPSWLFVGPLLSLFGVP